VLRLAGVSVVTRDRRRVLDDLSLSVKAGEILGVAGVEGNGQRPLADLLSSLVVATEGEVWIGDERIPTGVPGAMAAAGVGVIPEDRHDSAVVQSMTVAENLFLVDHHRVSKRGFLQMNEMRSRTTELIDEFGVLCGGPDAPMWSLSGGNQQRVVLAREL
jgi:simple sugar transport system ATP-binding protein